jgi:hypothetical protein
MKNWKAESNLYLKTPRKIILKTGLSIADMLDNFSQTAINNVIFVKLLYLKLEHGIPSHDTFGRLFGLIDALEFEAAFRRWVSSAVPRLDAEIVAIDGKTSRRTGKVDATPLHLVSAFAAGSGTAGDGGEIQRKDGDSAAPLGALARRLHRHDRCHGDADEQQITLNLIRLDPTQCKSSIKTRRLIAASSDTYRNQFLGMT